MYKEVYKNGGEMEAVELVAMSQEEMDKIRKASIKTIASAYKSGIVTKEEFLNTVEEMEISAEELQEYGMLS